MALYKFPYRTQRDTIYLCIVNSIWLNGDSFRQNSNAIQLQTVDNEFTDLTIHIRARNIEIRACNTSTPLNMEHNNNGCSDVMHSSSNNSPKFSRNKE
jgi:hypothetical protein